MDITIFIILIIIATIIHHYSLKDATSQSYWEGFWEGHAIAMENAIVARRLEQLDETITTHPV